MTKEVKIILLIAIIITVAGLGMALWYWQQQSDQQINTNTPPINGNTNIEPNGNEPATTTEPEIITSEIDISDWKTYRNEEWGFEVKYPKEYLVNKIEKEVNNESVISGFVISTEKNNAHKMSILPTGGFDYGLPFDRPQEDEIIIDNKRASKRFYKLQNNSYLVIIHLIGYNNRWNELNRIELQTGTNNPKEELKVFYKMIEGLKIK